MNIKDRIKSIVSNPDDYRDVWFFGISCFVVGEFALASTHVEVIKAAPITWWISMPFATVMAARTITFYGVARWIRRWFLQDEVDSCWAGNNNEPRDGKLEPLGWLLQCPICTGMHACSALTLLYAFFPDMGWVTSIMLAIAAGSMLLQHTAESLSWFSRLMRVLSGLISPDKNTAGWEARESIYCILHNLAEQKRKEVGVSVVRVNHIEPEKESIK